MKTIVNPVQIEKCCLKIKCGTSQGTAFYIAPEIIVTAYHVIMDVDDNNKIYASTPSGDKECTIRFFDKDQDFCALNIAQQQEFLPILSSLPKVNQTCDIYGYPYQASLAYLNLSGKITQILIKDISDFVISDLNIDGNFDYRGFSGAPVVVNGNVIGIVRRQIDDRISAVSINKLYDFLILNEIELEEEEFYHDIPDQFIDDINTSTPNFTVLNKLDKALETDKSWYLLKGSPGSGKSTIIASYTPKNENIVICGRYFTKIPNDNEPASLRTSASFFLSAIENLISITVTGYPSSKNESTIETRIQGLSSSLQTLSSFFEEQNKTAVLIIDGLDEVKNIDEFLGIFPFNISSNIKIILSCTSENILPVSFSNLISSDQIIAVTPIDLGQCEAFVMKEIGKEGIPISAIQAIATKSEGHPLYLRYLVNYIKTQELSQSEDELEEWIESIPNIGGDISNYYNKIWDKIYSSPDKLWILIILAQIRQIITKEELYDMLPQQYQLTFHSNYPLIKYLFNGTASIEIYHNSFRTFIISKTSESNTLANDLISKYCETNADNNFSITNILFHYSQGSTPEKSITKCNQDWADLCVQTDVSPDLVIVDLKKVIDVSLELQKTTEVIRLLLLLQRIEFRYDSVFAENANLMAKALISMGRYEAGLKYIVREKTLLVSNYDAISFLQIFYENDAINEAELLFSAIESRYRRVIDEGIQSKDGFSPEIFVLELNALSLSMNTKNIDRFEKFLALKNSLKELQKSAEESGDKQMYETLYSIREYASAWMVAYGLRRFDFYDSAEKASNTSGVQLDNKWARMRANSVISFNELNDYNTGNYEKTENYYLLIKDVEHLITNYGYVEEKQELQLLISALLEDSKNSTLTIEIINKYLQHKNEFNLRKQNGVDLNYSNIHALYLEYKCRGYANSDNNYPAIISKTFRYKNWEDYLISILKFTAFIEGKLFRLKADNKVNEIEGVISKLSELLTKIDFSLNDRSYWERSYHLPESILPIIYLNLTNVIANFNSDQLCDLINHIKTKSKDQLGLFSEGFRSCLFEISRTLIKCFSEVNHIMDILEILEKHILTYVQNRWERTPELLRVIELYGLINRSDLANKVFSEMLKTSMGPSWYKESHLALLNSVLTLKMKKKSETIYLNKFAGILDYSSGEMTFQRYVRNEKEKFVGNLAKHEKIDKAITYFQSEVIPSPEQLITNAESNNLDAPRLGDGYCLGARNINEQNSILALLDEIGNKAHFLKWALCETFVISDDTDRYAGSYAEHQAEILNHFESIDHPNLDDMLQVIAGIASNADRREYLRDYLRNIGETLTETNRFRLKAKLLSKNIEWNLDKKEEDKTQKNKGEPQNKFDLFNEAFKNKENINVEKLIENGLNTFTAERISIWMSNWSSSSSLVKENLKSLYSSDKQIISSLRYHINKYGAESWVITNKLLWFLEKNLTDRQIAIVYDIIAEHFSLMIQPTSEVIEKYNWLDSESKPYDLERELCNLLIWLLNHPVKLVNERTKQSILNLSRYQPDVIINYLFIEVLSEKPIISTEICSLILKEISEQNPNNIVNFLEKEPSLIERIRGIKHFGIKNNLLDLSINLNKVNYKILYEVIHTSIPSSIISTSHSESIASYLSIVQLKLYRLDDLQVLDTNFFHTLNNKIEEYCSPLSVSEYKKSDRYLNRSFYEERNQEGRFDYIVSFALNMAITPRVNSKNWKVVSKTLNNIT